MLAQTPEKAHKRRIVFSVFVLIFFLFISFVVYIRSPLARVQKIAVSGANDIATSFILHDTGIAVGQNLFALSPGNAKRSLLSDFPILQNAVITRDFWTRSVSIRLTEHTIAGILVANGNLYEVLADGTILTQDPAGYGVNRPLITTSDHINVGLGMRLTNPSLLAVCKQMPSIPENDLAQLSELHVMMYEGQPSILAFTKDQFEIRMPIHHIASSLALYDAIHQRLINQHAAPGLINLLGGGLGVYQPFKHP